MIIKRYWTRNKFMREHGPTGPGWHTYYYHGYFLLGFIPIYIRRSRAYKFGQGKSDE